MMHFSRHRRHLLVAGTALALSRAARAASPLRTAWPRGKPTPPLTLTLLDGTPWTLQAQHGHAVLLNFWASWCEPCVEEMPALARLGEREAPRGLRVLAVNYRETAAAIRRFLDRSPVAPDVALDQQGAAARAFDAHAFPSTIAIGADGRARFVVMGECDWDGEPGRRWLDELLLRR